MQRRMFLVALIALIVVAAIALIAISLSSSSTDESSAESSPGGTPEGTTGGASVERAETPETREAPAPPNGEPDDAPESVKGIYLTAENASDIEPFLDLIDRTEVNAVVVDVKDVTGEVMYPSDVPLADEIGATRETLDLERLASELEKRDIYAIARVATFEDDILPIERPDLAVMDSATGSQWRNYAGNTWADPYNREVWEYNVGIAKEAAEAGFDEI